MRPVPMPEVGIERSGSSLRITGLGRPFGVARDCDGRLLVADMDLHAVARFDPGFAAVEWLGPHEWDWSQPARTAPADRPRALRREPGILDGPHSVAVCPDGALWIVTYYRPGLHKVAVEGGSVVSWTQIGGAPLAGPATGHLDRGGRLWLTEYALNAVLALNGDGYPCGSLGGGITGGFGSCIVFEPGATPGAFDRPHMARALADGSVVVADTWNHRLQRYDSSSGQWLGWLGDGSNAWRSDGGTASASTAPGRFTAPVAIGAADDGRFVVTDWGNGRLQWFEADGRLLSVQDNLGLDKPYDAQPIGGRLAVADSHHGRVLILPMSLPMSAKR